MRRCPIDRISLIRENKSRARSPAASNRPLTFHPCLEALEARLVPSSVPLHVAGNQLLDAADNAVVLRGVNIISLEWRPDGDNVMQAVNTAITDWHANLLRLPVNEDFWFGHDQAWTGGDSGDGGAAYRNLVDQAINTAQASNVYVMLDLHWSDMGNWGANNGQHFLPDDHSTLFWQDAAPRYANSPAVLFDPYNEPHFENDQPTDAEFATWRNGGTITESGQFNGTYHSPGMQGLIDTIRATGANNVLAPEGLNWGSNLTGVLTGRALSDPAGNLMYQSHLYPNKLADAGVAGSVEGVAQNYPLYIGEWGSGGVKAQPSQEAAQANQDMLTYLDNHPSFSWTAWALTPSLDGEYNLLTDWNSVETTSDYGVFVKANLAAHANDHPMTPWTAVDVTVGNDGNARVLWSHTGGQADVWSLNGSTVAGTSAVYAVHNGWSARATAAGSDGLTRVLWNNSNGQTALWLLYADGSINSATSFGALSGWTAIGVSVGEDGNTRILWDHVGGQMVIWNVANDFNVTASPVFGPYSGWTGHSIAAGADGMLRVLWDNADGSTALWVLNADGTYGSSAVFGPVAGWTANQVVVDSAGDARIMWTNLSGQMAIWNVDASFHVTSSPIYGGLPGWTPTRVATGADGLIRVLWTKADGTASFWLLNADGSFQSATAYGPF